MKKDSNNICAQMSLEEFCNILEMLKSKDRECNILAKELLRLFVYEIKRIKSVLLKISHLNINITDDSNDQIIY